MRLGALRIALVVCVSGVGDRYLTIPYGPDFDFGSGDFTIETFVYKVSNNSNATRSGSIDAGTRRWCATTRPRVSAFEQCKTC